MYSQAYILIHMYVICIPAFTWVPCCPLFLYGPFFAKQRGQKNTTQHPLHGTNWRPSPVKTRERCDAPGCSIRYRLTHVLFDLWTSSINQTRRQPLLHVGRGFTRINTFLHAHHCCGRRYNASVVEYGSTNKRFNWRRMFNLKPTGTSILTTSAIQSRRGHWAIVCVARPQSQKYFNIFFQDVPWNSTVAWTWPTGGTKKLPWQRSSLDQNWPSLFVSGIPEHGTNFFPLAQTFKNDSNSISKCFSESHRCIDMGSRREQEIVKKLIESWPRDVEHCRIPVRNHVGNGLQVENELSKNGSGRIQWGGSNKQIVKFWRGVEHFLRTFGRFIERNSRKSNC